MTQPLHPSSGTSVPPLFLIRGGRIIPGAGRGRTMGIPTLNIALTSAPKTLAHGIYACLISFGGKTYQGAMHFGPRPVFKDTDALEVHVLDSIIDQPPVSVDLDIIGKIREVKDFPNAEALKEAIAQDIAAARAMLDAA